MKQTILIAIATLFFSFGISAQTITGKVTDTQNQPLEFANVALYSLPDSALLTGAVTNQQGEFSLAPNGTKDAFLSVSLIGYETITRRIVQMQEPIYIALPNSDVKLQEVVVEANRISRSAKGYGIVLTGSDFTKGKQRKWRI